MTVVQTCALPLFQLLPRQRDLIGDPVALAIGDRLAEKLHAHAQRIEERPDLQIGKTDATVRAMGQGHFECGQYARGLALEIMVPLTIFDGKGAADFPCRSEEHTSELKSLK